jgi:hypothetical protein
VQPVVASVLPGSLVLEHIAEYHGTEIGELTPATTVATPRRKRNPAGGGLALPPSRRKPRGSTGFYEQCVRLDDRIGLAA